MNEPISKSEALETSSPPSAAGARSRRFLFGRLADAVRRQDWFTVIVEIAIVVLGVVIGFQVNDWGQRRADRTKEQTYLRQLAADLRETAHELEEATAQQQSVNRSVAHALRAYRSPELPPLDTFRHWLWSSFNFSAPMPVLGTAQGIITSGDLALIRNDTLRAALTSHVERSRERRSAIQVSIELYAEAYGQIHHRADYIEAWLGAQTTSAIDSSALSNPDFLAPAGERVVPFPETSADLLADRDIYSALVKASIMNGALLHYQAETQERVGELMDLVSRELGITIGEPLPPTETVEFPAR